MSRNPDALTQRRWYAASLAAVFPFRTRFASSCSASAFSHASRSPRSSRDIAGPSTLIFARASTALLRASATSPTAPDTSASFMLMFFDHPSTTRSEGDMQVHGLGKFGALL